MPAAVHQEPQAHALVLAPDLDLERPVRDQALAVRHAPAVRRLRLAKRHARHAHHHEAVAAVRNIQRLKKVR